MPSIVLPPDTPLQSNGPVQLILRAGTPVLDQRVSYPSFFVKAEDITSRLEDYQRVKSRYSDRWPAQPTEKGLVWDPQWNAFAAFFGESTDYGVDRIVQDLADRKVSWSLCCPVVEGPESIIGQVMLHYGKHVGAVPGQFGFNPTSGMRDRPIQALLAKASPGEMESFQDRDRSLLDLAMQNQLWDTAQWLWDQGIRPTPKSLQGPYLESLVIASLALQESAVTGFLPCQVDRAQWLQGWLDRFTESQTPISDAPFSTYRQKMMEKNMGSLYDPDDVICDTIASFWISRCLFVHPSGPPSVNAVKNNQMFDAWVRFWSTHGVDLDKVSVPEWRNPPVAGVSSYMQTRQRPELWAPWLERLQWTYQARRLELETVPSVSQRPQSRL